MHPYFLALESCSNTFNGCLSYTMAYVLYAIWREESRIRTFAGELFSSKRILSSKCVTFSFAVASVLMTSPENLLYSTSFQLLFLQFVLSDHACKLRFFVSWVRKQRTQVTNLKSNKFVFRNNHRNVLCAYRCFFFYLFIYIFIHYSNLAYNTRNSIMNVNLAETLCLGMSLRNKTAVRLLWGINCKPGHLAGFDIDHARKQW